MSNSMIQLLDCTLRDGAYINGADFGKETITGIIKRLQNAKVEIIECAVICISIISAAVSILLFSA